jgi:threonine/homoserine/homoserine lactone efflux protein
MIVAHLFWPYLAASLICIAAPGPDSLSVLSIGLSRGRREAMQFALGVGTGCLTHTLWAALGMAAVVAASDSLFTAIKLAGAGYLLWIGIGALRAPGGFVGGRDGPNARGASGAARSAAVITGRRRFAQGFINNSLNPKVMLFFIAFLPQFVDPAAGRVSTQMLALGAGFALMTAFSYVLLGAASGRVGEVLMRRPSLARNLDRLVGCLFIGLAARLALTQRV